MEEWKAFGKKFIRSVSLNFLRYAENPSPHFNSLYTNANIPEFFESLHLLPGVALKYS